VSLVASAFRRNGIAFRRNVIPGLYLCLVAVTAVVVVWSMRQGWAVYKLRRGVGDTWFYSADGKPWFRMDEQRRDVSLDDIAPDMRNVSYEKSRLAGRQSARDSMRIRNSHNASLRWCLKKSDVNLWRPKIISRHSRRRIHSSKPAGPYAQSP